MYRSPSYLKWIEQADQLFLMNKKGPIKQLVGPFVCVLELHTKDGRKKKDADNRLKAPLDWLTRLGLIEDDKFMAWGIVGWVNEEEAPYGAKVTLWNNKENHNELLQMVFRRISL